LKDAGVVSACPPRIADKEEWRSHISGHHHHEAPFGGKWFGGDPAWHQTERMALFEVPEDSFEIGSARYGRQGGRFHSTGLKADG
jgi:hypothetical protein